MTKNRVCGTIVAICTTIFITLIPFYDKINTTNETQGLIILGIIFASVLTDLVTVFIWFEVEINVGQFPVDY